MNNNGVVLGSLICPPLTGMLFFRREVITSIFVFATIEPGHMSKIERI